jgi:rRNA processing protein Krr1/Pno1
MTNRLQEAIDCNDGDQAARIIQDPVGIESIDIANYCFPKTWPLDREQRARIIGEWLQTEARYLV